MPGIYHQTKSLWERLWLASWLCSIQIAWISPPIWMGPLTLQHLWIVSGMLGALNMFLRVWCDSAEVMWPVPAAAAGGLLLGYTVHAWTLIFYLLFSQSVEVKDAAVPAMFITAQRQLWSENLRVAEGNPFTSLPLGFTVGCLIQGIDFNHSCLAPKLPIDLPFWQLLVGNLITATYIVI